MKKIYGILLSVTLLSFVYTTNADIVFSHNNDSIFYDESTNSYVITYDGENGQINEVRWAPANDIAFDIDAKYGIKDKTNVEYKYKLKVNKTSKQSIKMFKFYGVNLDKPSVGKPNNWKSIVRDSYDEKNPGQWVNWFTSWESVKPGKYIEKFSIVSKALPAYGMVYAKGETQTLRYIDYGPNTEVQDYFEEKIVSPHVNGKSVLTAVPLIPVSVPFNPVATYTSFHNYLLEYIEKQYIEQSIANSLSQTSTEVLKALTNNLIDDAILNLKELKKLIEGKDGDKDKESKRTSDSDGDDKNGSHLIVKEVREILKFNVKYIKKKLKANSGHD